MRGVRAGAPGPLRGKTTARGRAAGRSAACGPRPGFIDRTRTKKLPYHIKQQTHTRTGPRAAAYTASCVCVAHREYASQI